MELTNRGKEKRFLLNLRPKQQPNLKTSCDFYLLVLLISLICNQPIANSHDVKSTEASTMTTTIITATSASNSTNSQGLPVDAKFCDNLRTSIHSNSYTINEDVLLLTVSNKNGAKYPFWIQCYLSNRNNYSTGGQILAPSSIVFQDSLLNKYPRYSYLSEVARVCEFQLKTHCPASFRLGLLSDGSGKCPSCGMSDLNCDNVNLCTNECGQIKSINYPFNYGNNHRCRWSIKAPMGHYVDLSVIDFDIPSSNSNSTQALPSKLANCVFDYLTLIDGSTGKRIGCYCNENLPPPNIVSPWNWLIIQFDTNSETTGRGFYFEYKFKKLELNDHIKRQLKPPIDSAMMNHYGGSLTIYNNSNASVCLPEWQYFRGSCYKAYNELEPLQWYDAQNRCHAHGEGLDGHLVSILDKDEMLVILYLLTNVWKSDRHVDYYIGLIDVSREGVYRWSDNNPMSYTDWELKPMLLEEETPAQPDGGAYEDCTIIRYNSYSRTSNWHDVPCSLGKHYHSHLAKSTQLNYKWDYVNSYICKTDSISIASLGSKSKVRRPLFSSNEFKQSQLHPGINNNPHPPGKVGDKLMAADGTVILLQPPLLPQINDLTQAQQMKWTTTTNLQQLDDNRYFVCDNQEVISVVLRCDGVTHCRDGSDESNGCDQDCLDWQFKCANGRCISIGYYCDYIDQCGDGSDESRCERPHRCKLNEFRCQSGQCIMASQRCDLLPDCSDSSDEGRLCTIGSNCNSASTFQCYNGNCIPQYAVCDFQIDCPGKFHEDEDVATCDLVLKGRSYGYNFSSPLTDYHKSPVAYYLANQDTTTAAVGWLKKRNLFKCTSGNMIDSNLRCLYEFDRYGFQIGCRDVTHLTDCAEFECPKRDYVKCSNSYCIPWRYICDGKWDCVMGEDEVGCARYVCPGQYKCANQSSCILLHQLCDGHRQCPMGDDEWFCDLQCPSRCDCIGQSVNCRGANLTQLSGNFISKSVRKLDLSYNKLGPNLSNCDFSAYFDLGELILHHNEIEVLIPRKFIQLINLYKLDLSYNQIHSVKRGAFAGLRRVTQLLLESNPELVILEPEAFFGLSSLKMLNISSSRILALKKNTFDGLTSLRHLLLRSNMIVEIEDKAFASLTSLVSLDMRGNEIRYFTKSVFSDLKSLRNLSTDSFKFCCLVNNRIPAERCLPLPDEISDCEDLLSSLLQRSCIWIAGIIACIGNSIVIAWRYYRHQLVEKLREEDQINSALLLSLGFSDLLMGVYLIMIAIVDTYYRGNYIENSDNWRQSMTCNLCGFLSTVSSEMSVFTLVLMAYNRYREICLQFKRGWKFTLVWTHRLIFVSWCVALFIATVPLVVSSYFHGRFYARSGVCLAFHLTNQKAAGWMYSIGVFLCPRLVAFVMIILCYWSIYKKMSRPVEHVERTNKTVKIATVVLTHIAAWCPTIVLEFLSLVGIALPIAVYSWVAVLVLPINSALNPILYTIPSICAYIRRIFQNHLLARKSGHREHLQTNGQIKEHVPLIVFPSKRLAPENVPPTFVPLKQFFKPSAIGGQNQKQANAGEEQLIKIACEIARNIEAKHDESKVYATLALDNMFVSDKISSTDSSFEDKHSANNGNDGRISDKNMQQVQEANMTSNLTVFIADYDGYLKKRDHNSRQHRRTNTRMECECIDLNRFGDILFKLLQLYKIRSNQILSSNTTTEDKLTRVVARQTIKSA